MCPVPPPDDAAAARPEAPVRALATGLAVLRCFTPDRPSLTVSSAAEAAGITRASARRVLHTLVHEGYAVQEGRRFALTPRVLELGHGYWTGTSLAELLRPVLVRASQVLEQSCSAAVLDGPHLLYIARVHTERILRVNLDVGTRLPAFLTSMGRVLLADLPPAAARRLLEGTPRTPRTPHTRTDVAALLAELERVREQDHAVVTAELDAQLSSVAVPVRGPDGTVVAAINTALPHRAPGPAGPGAADPTRAAVAQALPVLREAAQDAEDALLALRR